MGLKSIHFGGVEVRTRRLLPDLSRISNVLGLLHK